MTIKSGNVVKSIMKNNYSKSQQKLIDYNLEEHKNSKYRIDLYLTKNIILKDFIVDSGVLRPEKMSALSLAQWLFSHSYLYKNKTVLDMGCGTGIQGIAMAKGGAKKIIFSDISIKAINNAKKNIKKFRLIKKSKIHIGDLFGKVEEKVDVIVFNHPFVISKEKEFGTIMNSLIGKKDLMPQFFQDAKKYLNKDGSIIMPYYLPSGRAGDPGIQGPKYGFNVISFCKVYLYDSKKWEDTIYHLKFISPKRSVFVKKEKMNFRRRFEE